MSTSDNEQAEAPQDPTTSHNDLIPPSSEYFERVLTEAWRADPDALRRAASSLAGRLVHVVVETALQDESFYIISGSERIQISTTNSDEYPAVYIRVTPAVVRDILHGELTPVEAFFMGKLRARGTTRNLYAF